MRRLYLTPLVATTLLFAACGGGDAVTPSTTTLPTTTTTTAPTTTTTEPRPVWEGFAATNDEAPTLVAIADGPVEVFAEPGAGEPKVTVDEATILGTVTVLGVVTEPTSDGWVEVMLPMRPNGSTGWARADDLSFYIADSRIVVELGARRLTYLVDDVPVLETEVGVGSVHNETPVGEFFVTDSVTLTNPNSPWGPHALGLSARSNDITEFNGGDGIIGIHGTNNPSSIGGNISLGCVRLPNDMITELHGMVPIGTRVEIKA
ncbi:MAG TPA: L,D-transpeptidase [Acidimicrobiia bacterium]|nr:L,D-transpeptidase [Acidimicrobiia bacterium]